MVAKRDFLSGTVSQRGKPVRSGFGLAGSHGSAVSEANPSSGEGGRPSPLRERMTTRISPL